MTLTFEEFKKTELRVAKVLDVQEIPGADRLWKLLIDVGSEKKEIVAGIKMHYTREALLGKSIIVVNNLTPTVIRGVESNGMLLAASVEGGSASGGKSLTILTLDKEVPPGSPVG